MGDAVSSSEVLSRFAMSIAGSGSGSGIRATPLGLFIPESELPSIIKAYKAWQKSESASKTELEDSRCYQHIFGTTTPDDFYLLDGKKCVVGSIIKIAFSPELKSKFQIYSGNPIDGRTTIHPKDPILDNLPDGIRIESTTGGMELCIKSGKSDFRIQISRLQDLAYLIGNSPRLRKYKNLFSQAQRRVVAELAMLLKQGKSAPAYSLKFIPSRYRNRSDVRYMILSDLILILTADGKYISGYGIKARNLLDFLHQEIKTLASSVRSGKIGDLNIRHIARNCAGTILSKQDRFLLEYQALMDFMQIYRFEKSQNSGKTAKTLFDFLKTLSAEFTKSDWALERDISPRLRGKAKEQLNYRTARGWVFWVRGRSHIVAVRRSPR